MYITMQSFKLICNLEVIIFCETAGSECEDDASVGPHTMDCLVSLWTEAGCNITGSKSPLSADQEQLDWWNARTVGDVRYDMQLYFRHAADGIEDYPEKCFGSENEPGCTYQAFPGQALYDHNDVILRDVTLGECKERCNDIGDECLSFDYSDDTMSCFLSADNRYDWSKYRYVEKLAFGLWVKIGSDICVID